MAPTWSGSARSTHLGAPRRHPGHQPAERFSLAGLVRVRSIPRFRRNDVPCTTYAEGDGKLGWFELCRGRVTAQAGQQPLETRDSRGCCVRLRLTTPAFPPLQRGLVRG